MGRIRWTALASDVLAVAHEGDANDWTAYIGAVPGIRHDDEYQRVLGYGAKLQKEVAVILFPDFARDFEWRR